MALYLFSLRGPGQNDLVSSSYSYGEPHRLPAPLGDFAQCHSMLVGWMVSKGRNELIHFIIGSCFQKVLIPNGSLLKQNIVCGKTESFGGSRKDQHLQNQILALCNPVDICHRASEDEILFLEGVMERALWFYILYVSSFRI